MIPDVVLSLPGDRQLVIDSKFTLVDYRVFASHEVEAERADALRRHLNNIRNHVRGLAEKNYQSLYGFNWLDFVVVFIPLEPVLLKPALSTSPNVALILIHLPLETCQL